MSARVTFQTLDFASHREFPRVRLKVLRYSWRALGGPDQAELYATGSQPALAELADSLRSPLVIWNSLGTPAWCGYLASTCLQKGSMTIENSLDQMANRVRAWYRGVAANRAWVTGWAATVWADDLESQARYGIKEAQLTLDSGSLEQALQTRDAFLKLHRLPTSRLTRLSGNPTGETRLRLQALGWWHSLAWRSYAQPAGLAGDALPASGWTLAGTPASQALRQGFSIPLGSDPWPAQLACLRAHPHGSPAGNLVVELHSSTGALLATGSLSPAAVASQPGWVEVPFAPAVVVIPGTTYDLRILQSGLPDAVNAYRLDLDRSAALLPGLLTAWNGSAWLPLEGGGSLLFKLEAVEDSLAQARRMLAPSMVGQFLNGVSTPVQSGVLAPLWREGSHTAREEIETLLKLGTSDGRQLLAATGSDRLASIYASPLPGEADYTLKPDGSLVDPYGLPVPAGLCPAGVWVRGENLPETHPGNPRAFIERCEWDEEKGRLLLR